MALHGMISPLSCLRIARSLFRTAAWARCCCACKLSAVRIVQRQAQQLAFLIHTRVNAAVKHKSNMHVQLSCSTDPAKGAR